MMVPARGGQRNRTARTAEKVAVGFGKPNGLSQRPPTIRGASPARPIHDSHTDVVTTADERRAEKTPTDTWSSTSRDHCPGSWMSGLTLAVRRFNKA